MNLLLLLLLLVAMAVHGVLTASSIWESEEVGRFRAGRHSSNWAVLVDTSRFWFNYRHQANVLGMYHAIRRLGIPDSRIILMIADDKACDARNTRAGQIFATPEKKLDMYGNAKVDYRGYEVTAENFVRVLTGRHNSSVPRSKRLLSDENSNVLVYMTGHGGDNFLKFQDAEEITSRDVADTIAQMYFAGRYNEMLFVLDTCQATTMFEEVRSPNVFAIGSSKRDQSSYSTNADHDLAVSLIDRFTYHTLLFMERLSPSSEATMHDYLSAVNHHHHLLADVGWRHSMIRMGNETEWDRVRWAKARSFADISDAQMRHGTAAKHIKLTDFFASVIPTRIVEKVANVVVVTSSSSSPEPPPSSSSPSIPLQHPRDNIC